MKKRLLITGLLLSLFTIATNIFAQEVSPGVLISDDNSIEKADESAILDISSESKGFLPPRLTLEQRNAIADPAEGLIIFNTTTKKINYFDGINWVELGESLINNEKNTKASCYADITVNGVSGHAFFPLVGSTLQLSTPAVALAFGSYATYSWTGPNNWSSTEREPVISNIALNMTGEYYVVVSINGIQCATDYIDIKVQGQISITANNTGPYCEGETINLYVEGLPTGGTYTYSWSGPNGWTSTSASPNRVFSSTLMAGTYYVTATNQSGGIATGSTGVIVYPGYTTSYHSTVAACTGDIITLNPGFPTCSGCTYSWSGPNGYTNNVHSPQLPITNQSLSGDYNVTITNSYGCTGTSAVSVSVGLTPSAAINGDSEYCVGETISLSTPENDNFTYSWTGPGNFSSTSSSISRLTSGFNTRAGTYYLTVTDVSGCSATNQLLVTVNPIHTPIPSCDKSSYCPGETINLSANVITGATYSWSGPGGWTSTLRTPSRTNATSAMAGTYYVVVTNVYGCTNRQGVVVNVNTIPATPTAGTHSKTDTQITWNWNSVSNATGYKWGTTNNYSNAIDKGTVRSHTETGLGCGTTYTRYVWAYNNCGYSATPLVITFSTEDCPPSCTGEQVYDIDGNLYLGVQIGDQCWLDRNLKTTKYKNGNSITYLSGAQNTNDGAGYSWNINNTQYGNIYGALYNGVAVQTGNLCPAGWHVPTISEWGILKNLADGLTGGPDAAEAGKVLKDTRCELSTLPTWNHCTGATNSTGFGALAGGSTGTGSTTVGRAAWFWSSTVNGTYLTAKYMQSENNQLYEGNYHRSVRLSVRCIKDEE
ncbi:MAG: hypothetical protein LBQ22_09080 [Bacteroidales bacterium]|nr:hypothetical protein [Bacteroidales bacterium]